MRVPKHPALIAAFCALFVMGFAADGARAASVPARLPAPVIAIVDVQRILQESLASKSVQKQLDAQRAKFQNEIEIEENGLSKAERSLADARDKLSPQAYAEREQALRQRFSVVENHVQSRRNALDESYSTAMNTVRAALLQVVGAVAREHGANVVIVKQQALWTDKPLDITGEVLARLDKKLPQVTVHMPAEETGKKKK
ncbi:MAG: OmpH family outer membrane protein [Alphaproteobacteria bacterium]|nr:OmpH family outer membrane protein [Alphaproteobacteria bacterium]